MNIRILTLAALSINLFSLSLAVDHTSRREPDLRVLAASHRFNIGAAMPASCLKNDVDGGQYSATAASTFNFLELENDLKPPAIWVGPHQYHFSDVDFVLGEPGKVGWAQRHRLRVRGHVLVYASDNGYTLPGWLRKSESDISKAQAGDLLHEYIRAVAGRYRGKIAMWDVANEAIDDRPNKNAFNLRDSFWFRKLGPEFLVLAFKWAHEADPRAELYYNDYAIEGGGAKANHVLDLARWLKAQRAPITGLGLQYHIDCRTSIVPGDGHYKLLDDIRELRLHYMITELDVAVPVKILPNGDPDRGMIPSNRADLELQAQTYAAVFQMALSTKNCRGINIWGLTDRYSWIPGFSGGRNGAATIFDKEYKPKSAYFAIADMLKK